MSTSRPDEKEQTSSLDWKALFQDLKYAGSSHLVSSMLIASSSEKTSDPRMTQSQVVNRPNHYTVTITPPEPAPVSRFSFADSGLFLSAPRPTKQQEKIDFLKAQFPSLFVKGSLVTDPVIIMKNDAGHEDYEEMLRQQPTKEATAAFNRSGYLVVKHVSMKKCVDKLQALTLEQLQSGDVKDIFDDILEDTIGDLEPFKSDDDIVLTESGHSYLSAPLRESLEIKQVDPNTNEVLKNNKLVKDVAVKTFLEELDRLVELNHRKSLCNSTR